MTRGALLLIAVATACACDGSGARRWDWSRMRTQRRYELYAAAPVLPQGREAQAPPPGTVPRAPASTAGALALGTTFTVPTADQIALGRERYDIFCAVCHGVGGYSGSIVASNMSPVRPPALRSPAARALTDSTIYEIITSGFGRMPSYAAELQPLERWAVIAYVRELQQRTELSAADRSDSLLAALMHAADSASQAIAAWQRRGAAPPTDTSRGAPRP